MDERTPILISLGASVAVNCMPCFEHYLKKAKEAGLTDEEINIAVDTARRVKKGADVVICNFVSEQMKDTEDDNGSCDCSSEGTCC